MKLNRTAKLKWLVTFFYLSVIAAACGVSNGTKNNLSNKSNNDESKGIKKSIHLPALGPLTPEAAYLAHEKRDSAAGGLSLTSRSFTKSTACVASGTEQAVDIKILLLAGDGNETSLLAIKSLLERIGIPFDVLTAATIPLTADMLSNGANHGYYQGIILTTSSLVYTNEQQQFVSALSAEQWDILAQYQKTFGVRQATLYTWPTADLGFQTSNIQGKETTSAPLLTRLTAEGAKVFPYLKANQDIPIRQAWTYLTKTVVSADTSSLLETADGNSIASIHRWMDGRENLALTTDHTPYLIHSQLLLYGVTNWVMKGKFLGSRQVYMAPQVDDFLIANDIWDDAKKSDQTNKEYRMSGADLRALIAWQTPKTSSTITPNFKLELVFNGQGAAEKARGDTLIPEVLKSHTKFKWVNHTYSHLLMEKTSYAESRDEISKNHNVATTLLKLTNYNKNSIVTPEISGLANPDFLKAAKDFGIRYLVSDTSKPEQGTSSPNTGIINSYQPLITMIPRYPANLYYNVSKPAEWVSEYNYFYAPGGKFAFWDHALTYAEIIDKESDVWLSYLLTFNINPVMFHQANLRAYNGKRSLLGDLIDATLLKYKKYTTLPVLSPSMLTIGNSMKDRMAYNNSGVCATLLKDKKQIILKTTKSALIPLTGIMHGSSVEQYGGQYISKVRVKPDQPVVIAAP